VVAELSLCIEGGPDARGDARAALRRFRAEMDAPALEVVTLLVSELVTNAVRHGRADLIDLHVALVRGCVRVDVVDHGPGFTAGPNPVAPGEEGGFGLFLVDELATRWGVHDHRGTRVWFELDCADRTNYASDGTRTRDLRRDRPAL
jgi:serine/threonine-protein kinase RsbW